MTTVAEAHHLTPAQLDALALELDAVRVDIAAQLGTEDVRYIRRLIRIQRWAEIGGRASFFLGFLPPFWLAGVAGLSLSKILDNMEIGHNVLHGQYDWTNDPALSSTEFEWDSSCPAKAWQHYHNYLHHTFTNITDKDRDLGYSVIRINEDAPWSRANLGNPLYALGLAAIFDHGIMLHGVDVAQVRDGKKPWAEAKPTLRAGLHKSGRLAFRDYIMWPAFTGPLFLLTMAGNALANLIRNLWSFIIIFCGHFPHGVLEFTEAECEGESKGHWYFRQVLGSGNITGGRLFHIMSGNLSYQIEHHLFPDIPARRYQQIAPQVREICQRYGIPYNTGRLSRQFGSVIVKIFRCALPPRRRPVASVPPKAPKLDPAELLAA
jgi:fatty acid desaturase